MSDQIELVTIYQTDGETAQEEAEQVCDLLVESGLTAIATDDADDGVEEGFWEVRVPAEQAGQATEILTAASAETGDPSGEMDLVPLFEEGTDLSEMEAMNIKGLLDANGIPAVIFGSSSLPNIPFDVRVPLDQLEIAEKIIADAAAAVEPEDTAPQA